MYLIINGGDGAGKDTQFYKIAQRHPEAVLVREPGGTPEAEKIREVILFAEWTDKERLLILNELSQSQNLVDDCRKLLFKAREEIAARGLTGEAEVYLYAASRAQTNQTLVIPALKKGELLLGRRSVACSMAYQGFARGLGMDMVWRENEKAINGAMPDLEIFLKLPHETAMARLKNRTEKQDRLDLESDEFHRKTMEGYERFYKEYCPYPYIFVEASGAVDEVELRLKALLDDFFKTKTAAAR